MGAVDAASPRSRQAGVAGLARFGPARLSIGARVTLSFGAGALVLCLALSTLTYLIARNELVGQAENNIEQEAYANATAAAGYLNEGFSAADILAFLYGTTTAGQSISLLYLNGRWTDPSPRVHVSALPAELREKTIAGTTPFEQVVEIDGGPHLLVGVPIVRGTKAYFGIFSLAEAERTLRILVASLALAVVATTTAGAVLGRWVSRRALRPLREVADAALAIANGAMNVRLETGDVRELGLLADSFNRMVDRLQERIALEARFASDVSHELRSPLTTLTAAASVLETRREELPARAAEALDLVGAELRHFQQLVTDLLEISRIDAGVEDLALAVVEAGELVRRAVLSWGKQDVRVTIEPDVDHRLVTVDKRRFERIVANLLDNAERYGGGARHVGAQRVGSTLRLTVDDEGPGIDPDERERIFERFARGRLSAGTRGQTVGTGLGLALVTEHVRLHKGHVYATDRPGGGARFVVELPLSDDDVLGEYPSEVGETLEDAPRPLEGARDGAAALPHGRADR